MTTYDDEDEKDFEDECDECEEFWVVLEHISTGIISVIHVYKTDGKWYEDNVLGNKGGDKTYQSYMDADDIMCWMMRDFDRYDVTRVDDEDEVNEIVEQEHARRKLDG